MEEPRVRYPNCCFCGRPIETASQWQLHLSVTDPYSDVFSLHEQWFCHENCFRSWAPPTMTVKVRSGEDLENDYAPPFRNTPLNDTSIYQRLMKERADESVHEISYRDRTFRVTLKLLHPRDETRWEALIEAQDETGWQKVIAAPSESVGIHLPDGSLIASREIGILVAQMEIIDHVD